jgi:hypothetical protein
MKKISLFLIGLILFSCHKDDMSIPPGLIKGNLFLSEVWENGVLLKKYEYDNGKMIKFSRIPYTTTFNYFSGHSIHVKGIIPDGLASYGSENNLSYVHYLTEPYFPKNDQLSWDKGELIEYRSTQSSLLTSHDRVRIDSFIYNNDRQVEIRTYYADYYHNEIRNQGFSGSKLFRWHSPFVLHEITGENKYSESRFSGSILSPDYNIVNFPWLTNQIGVSNTSNLINMLVSTSFGHITVSSRMLKLEVREVVNGKSMVVSRVENLKTNKDRLPVSYDLKDMAKGTVTQYMFKYVTL